MRYEHPEILYLLFALPLLGAFYYWAFARRRRLIERFAGAAVVHRLTATRSVRKQVIKAVAICAAIGCVIVALARPQWGYAIRDIEREGVDVYVAIDTSRSMLARDMAPDRLTRARHLLGGLVRQLRGDRVGIIAFAGRAIILCPLTTDYGLALNALDAVDVDTVPVQGTAIGSAVRTAVESFERSGQGRRVLILLTDGEDQGTDPLAAARQGADADVTIYTIGIGSREGHPIPVNGGFKRDEDGAVVNSRLDAETLRQIAMITGGKYIEARPGGVLEVAEVYAGISAMEKTLLEARTRAVYHERFPWFLLAAVALLAGEMALNERKRRLGDIREKTV